MGESGRGELKEHFSYSPGSSIEVLYVEAVEERGTTGVVVWQVEDGGEVSEDGFQTVKRKSPRSLMNEMTFLRKRVYIQGEEDSFEDLRPAKESPALKAIDPEGYHYFESENPRSR